MIEHAMFTVIRFILNRRHIIFKHSFIAQIFNQHSELRFLIKLLLIVYLIIIAVPWNALTRALYILVISTKYIIL